MTDTEQIELIQKCASRLYYTPFSSHVRTRTGKFITHTDLDYERRVIPSKRMMKMLDEAPDHTVAALHNHPGSTLPSPSDIHVLNERKNAYGVVACHDGTIYKYKNRPR